MMKDKVTLSELSSMLALASGCSKNLAEDFVKEFFSLISATLESGESVRIKNFGTFKISSIDGHRGVNIATGDAMEISSYRRISFIPAKEMSATVNKAFEMFEAVEVADDVTDEMLDEIGNETRGLSDVSDEQEDSVEMLEDAAMEDTEHEEAVEILETPIPEEELPEVDKDFDAAVSAEEQKEVEDESELPVDDISEEIEDEGEAEDMSVYGNRKRGRGWLWFVAGILLGVVTAFTVILISPADCRMTVWLSDLKAHIERSNGREASEKPSNVVENSKTVATPADSISDKTGVSEEYTGAELSAKEVAPTQPSDKKVITDMVTQTRYLGTMAREYYGDYHYWPYIYEANSKILGHPDRIRPGTKVVIPDLKDLGVDPGSGKDLAEAKRKGMEIYSRYK